jgi:hypothetical protein
MKNRGIQLTDGTTGTEEIDLKIEVFRNIDGKIEQGLIIGEIKNQTQAMILIANPGEFKHVPTLGVAIAELTLDDDYLRFRSRIREHLQRDGLKVKSLEFSKNKPLKIDAVYE